MKNPSAKPGRWANRFFTAKMRLVDPQTGNDVAVGETGELWIRRSARLRRLLAYPQATQDAITDGWFHTGDGARQDEDGCFNIVGRFKDMIKSGGEILCCRSRNDLSRSSGGAGCGTHRTTG